MRSILSKNVLKKAAGLFLGASSLFSGTQSFAAEFTSKASGSWNSSSTWTYVAGSGATTLNYPTTGDIANISDKYKITASTNIDCQTLNMISASNSDKNSLDLGTYTLTVGDISISGSNSGSTTLTAGSGTINITGSFTKTGTSPILDFGTSTVNFNGSASQTIANFPYYKVKISNPIGVTLGSDLTLTSDLDLSGGILYLGSSTLTIGQGLIKNQSEAHYINVGTGKLSITNIGTTPVVFPIGNGSYTPATISNAGTAQTFSVGIDNSVNGVSTHIVKKTWNVSSSNLAANVSLTLQWNAGDEEASFKRESCTINHYMNGAWETKGNTIQKATDVNTNIYSLTRSGITSFSPFAVGDKLSPLPVELVSFQAVKKDAAVVLNWETATEKNNKGFEVQASANGKTFETIAFVASQNGTANYSQRYAYTDKVSGKEGMMYYRLKQVDLDGTITFSSVKAVDLGRTSTVVTAFPNPFQNQFELSLQTSANQNATVIVTDLAGKIVYNATQTLQKGSNNLKVSLTNQPAGIYLIKATAGNQTYTNRLVKQ